MDPELAEAEKEALNKIVDDVQKLNQQLQRFLKSMAESSKIQTAYKAPSMEERLERIMERLAKMLATQKSESDVGAVDLSNQAAEESDVFDDHIRVSTVNESAVVAVTDTEVPNIFATDSLSILVLNDAEISEESFETELCVVKYTLSSCLQPVCEKFDSEPSVVALKNSKNFGIQAVRQNASKVMILYLPPAKPPDDILNGLQDAHKTILSYFDMLRDLIVGSRTLWHWSYAYILLVCPPLPPDMTRYLIIIGGVLIGIDVVIQGCLELDDFTVVSRFGCHRLCFFVGIRQIQNKDYYWVLAFFRGKMQLSWNCVNLLLIPGLGMAVLPSSSLWRLLIFSVWSSLNINAMQDPNIGVILFCAQNLFEQSDEYCAQPKIKKLPETTAVGARLDMIGKNEEEHYVWVSQVSGSFIMATDISCENLYIGIKIVLFIKDDQHQLESFEEGRLEDLIKKHSEFIGSYSWMCMTNLGSYYQEKRLDSGHNDDLYGDIIVSSLGGVFGYGNPATIEDTVILWKDEKVPVTYHGSSLVVVSNDVTFVKIKVDLCKGEGYLEWISSTVWGLQILLNDENFKGFLMANSQASHNIIGSVATYKFSYENSWLLGIYHWYLIHFWGHFLLLVINGSRNKLEEEEWIFKPCGLKLVEEKMMELSLEHEQTMFVSSLSYSDGRTLVSLLYNTWTATRFYTSTFTMKGSRGSLNQGYWIYEVIRITVFKYKKVVMTDSDEWPSTYSKFLVELDGGPEPYLRDPRRLVKVSLLQDSVYASIFEFVPDALMEPRFVIIVVDIGLCHLWTEIWKEQLNLLNKYKDEVQFISMIIHDTSTDAHVELPRKMYYPTVNKSLYKVKMSKILDTFISEKTLDAQSDKAGFKQVVFATQVTIWDIAVGFGSPAMNLQYHLSFWFSSPRPPESNKGKSSLLLLERIFVGSFVIAERYNQEVETYFIPYGRAVAGGPWRSNCTDGSCFNNIFLDAFVSSATYINHIFMFSLPRPPDIVDLEDKVILKEGGMLRIQISRSLRT